MTYLKRYVDGEFVQVWDELVNLGDRVRTEPVYSDAKEVCRELMQRVKSNCLTLCDRLTTIGYVLGQGEKYYPGPCVPPDSTELARLEVVELQAVIPTLPMSICTFWEVVGSVNLKGYHPRWPSQSDPLWVDPILGAWEVFRYWDDCGREEPLTAMAISPDIIQKDGASGSIYEIGIPAIGIDSIVYGLKNSEQITFVEYLRKSFEWGGFPGLADVQHKLHRELELLRHGLLPF